MICQFTNPILTSLTISYDLNLSYNLFMQIYLDRFSNFLQEKLGDDLVGLIIYGSYVRGYFDPLTSDYDVMVLFKKELPGLKEEIKEKFPKVSLQVYGEIDILKQKIALGSWSTYIVLAYTGKIIYQNPELEKFIQDLKTNNPFNLKLLKDNKKKVMGNLADQTELAATFNGFELNKFLYSSLIKRFQLLHFIKTGEILLNYMELFDTAKEECGGKEYGWLKKVEMLVFARSNELITDKHSYLKVLQSLDKLINKRL